MPRSSPHHIVLSPEEERELRRVAAKYTLPYYRVLRAKMILLAAVIDDPVITSYSIHYTKLYEKRRTTSLQEAGARKRPAKRRNSARSTSPRMRLTAISRTSRNNFV